jgi:hypothetical protein
MTHTRFLQVKRSKKLNDNGEDRTNEDPAQKFDLIYKCIVHNTNILTKEANLDQCFNEITFGHGGYGPKGSGLMCRLINKKSPKVRQRVLCSDVGRNRIRAYSHRHRKHTGCGVGWGREGPCEARRIAETIINMVFTDNEGERPYLPRGIFREKPCFTADNYFGNDVVDHWMGSNGFGYLHTT